MKERYINSKMQACTVRLEIAFSTFKQKQPSFTHAHTLVNTKTQTMLIVSYLSSRQFTGYRISAKLILSSVSKYRECLHGSWHSQLDERNAIPSIPSRAPPIELYTDCSPRGGLQVFEIIFPMKETNVENHRCFVSFGRILRSTVGSFYCVTEPRGRAPLLYRWRVGVTNGKSNCDTTRSAPTFEDWVFIIRLQRCFFQLFRGPILQ